jgi:hypothetical protein
MELAYALARRRRVVITARLSAACKEARTIFSWRQWAILDLDESRGLEAFAHWRVTRNRRSSLRRRRPTFYACRYLRCSDKPSQAGCPEGGWGRNGASLGPCFESGSPRGPIDTISSSTIARPEVMRSTDQTKKSRLSRYSVPRPTGRPQAVRGTETDGNSRKFREVTLLLLTSQKGVPEHVGDVPGRRRERT